MNNSSDSNAEAKKNCQQCPRLVDYRHANRTEHPDWFNGAVPSFGQENSEVLIVGLAPGVTGANRTGRPFTGDWAGDLLYATLAKFNLSEGQYDRRPDDGLRLKKVMITNAVRCVPPQNKPTHAEIKTCRPFLTARLNTLPHLKVILALGKIAHDSTIAALGLRLKDYPFGHANRHDIPVDETITRPPVMFDSYHCSRYNTNTRRLTPEMFENVFEKICAELK